MPILHQPELFSTYRSNTVAGTCNNSTLHFDRETTITGKLYYKIRRAGTYNYRFFFSNIADSTFADGSSSWANLAGAPFEILSAYAGDGGAEIDPNGAEQLVPLTFDGSTGRKVGGGETFWSDAAELTIPEGHYLVFTWTVRGTHLPYTPDKIIPSFVKNANGNFVESKEFPQPQLVGCDAPFERTLAFWGDSITQGLGTTPHRYASWAAKIGHAQPDSIAVWNIGLGFARAKDAASGGIWAEKAAVNDTVVLCFGVNDILHEAADADSVCEDLEAIIDRLNANGVRVILFTVPAFDWTGEKKALWDEINRRIRTDLAKKVFGVFDMAAATSRTDIPGLSRYGAHPNDEGGTAIAEAFLAQFPAL